MAIMENSTHEMSVYERPKVNVMIRCKSTSFTYSDLEMETMIKDIESFKVLGVDRFVFGSLTKDLDVNTELCIQILAAAHPLPVTFHRAFDIVRDPDAAITEIIRLGFTRLLTSGQQDQVTDPKAIKLITKLQKEYGNKIEIMPGSGINQDNVKKIVDLGFKIVHGSFKGGNQTDEEHIQGGKGIEVQVTQENVVKRVKDILGTAEGRADEVGTSDQ